MVTYHSYETALICKEQLDLIQQHEKERAKYHEETLAQFLEKYVGKYSESIPSIPQRGG